MVGIATHNSICQAVQPTVLLKLRRIQEVMTADVITAPASVPVIQLAQQMAMHRVSCVVITALPASNSTECAPQPVGIVTERDIVQFKSVGLDLTQTPAHSVMSQPLTCLTPTDSLWVAYETMQQLHVRRLVVCDRNGDLAGILTQSSLLSVLNPIELCTTIDVLQQQVDQLTHEKVSILETLNHTLLHQAKDSETRAQDSKTRFQKTFEQAATGMVHVDFEGNFLRVNQRFCEIVGYSQNQLLNKTVLDLSAPADRAESQDLMQQLVGGEISSFSLEKCYRRSDGEMVWVSVSASLLTLSHAKDNCLAAVIEDISQRKAAEEELMLHRHHLEELVIARTRELNDEIYERKRIEKQLFQEKELAQVTLQSIGDAVITTDAQGCVQYLTPVAQQLTGWSQAAAFNQRLSDVFVILHETTRERVQNPVERVLATGCTSGLANHTILQSREGVEYGIDDSAAPLRDRKGQMIGAVMVFRAATHARQISRQLSWQAGHDALTNLVNRRQFERVLSESQATLQGDQQYVLCYLDIDRFKVVNDTCGHTAGDELLKQVAAIISQYIRAADTLARLGGDEFAILLPQCPLARAIVIANQIRAAVTDFHFVWEGSAFRIGVSIGLVTFDTTAQDVASIVNAADLACYTAKEKGRNRVQVYQPDAAEIVKQRGQQRWSIRIRQALDREGFCLFQQPIVPALGTKNTEANTLGATNTPAYYEILLRMIDDDGKLISPAAFIPSAERYDLMLEIDQWVVNAFFRYLSNSLSHTDGSHYMINLSGASMGDEDFLAFLKARLCDYTIHPERICFEITETAAIANITQAVDFIQELKQLGFRFALDDFGSGMSSFAYLKTLPVDYIKIDGRFITDVAADSTALAIVKAINNIGHVMGLKTIAEFVETKQVETILKEVGLNFMQGYGIAMPTALPQ